MIRNCVRALIVLLATLAVPATMLTTMSPASAAPALPATASRPRAAAARTAHTASSSSQRSAVYALSCPVYTYNWYLQNSRSYSVMMDTSNDTYISVHQLQRFGNIIWNFCRVGTRNGDPVFELVDEGTYGVVGDCAADTGPALGSGSVAYFRFKSCTASGTSFIERPRSGGHGFRLESLYELNKTGRADYITVRAPKNNYRLFLAPGGTDWQAWNGSPCSSSTYC